ncbi:MAG: hypothetical protein LH477_13885 [Nocardioides sp.]|nr:hypothetical protein [Nocardioides sp.]
MGAGRAEPRGGDEDPEAWVRRHVGAAHAEESADHVLVVATSLGTRAASYAAEPAVDAYLSAL